jgi:hypothetical protein
VQSGAIGTTPTSGDSSTKIPTTLFVQQALAALNPLASVDLATIAILPNTPTYNNGTAGVGATLTRTGNGTLTVDGTVAVLNNRVLVKNQVSTFQNGVYLVTAAGDGSNPWVLTRATDYNTAANIDSVGAVPVAAGGTLVGTLWLEQLPVTTIGTDPLTYIQIAAAQGTGGGNGNNLAGDVTGKANKNTIDATVAPAFPDCTVVSGTTTSTLTPKNKTHPVSECHVLTLSGNNTTTTFASTAAPVSGWSDHFWVCQPNPIGGGPFTFAALAAGSGTAVTFATTGGCAAQPTMPTSAGSCILFALEYHTGPATPQLQVPSCPTFGS